MDTLLERFCARIPDGRDFALKHRTLLLESREGIPIDVALGGIDFEELVVSRANRPREGMPGVHSRINCFSLFGHHERDKP